LAKGLFLYNLRFYVRLYWKLEWQIVGTQSNLNMILDVESI